MPKKEVIAVNMAASNPNLSAATKFGNLVFVAGQTGRAHERLLEGQSEVVAALGDGADSACDGGPAIALVVAQEDVAVRGAGEEHRAARPDVQREAFDVAVDVARQAALEIFPPPAAV